MPVRPTSLPTLLVATAWLGCGSDAATQGTPDGGDASDTPLDGTLFPETVEADSGPEEVAPDAAPEPGAFGAPCVANGDCDSGYCVEGPSGYICTRACDTSCPEGFDCKSIPGQGDVSFVCVPRLDKRCAACTDDLQCGGGACLLLDGAGACTTACDADADCAEGFRCGAAPAADREGSWCLPVTASCTCSRVEDLGERACSQETAAGTCFGVERCDPASGWGACSATRPGPEDCNGLDDDCNGRVDDALATGGACDNTVAGVGSCAGVRRCAGTLGWACEGPLPEPEACDGEDDDCDGATDEDFKDDAGGWTLASACGRCGNDCTTRFVNGVGRCGGPSGAPRCEVDRCDAGFVLLEGQCVPPIDTTCQSCVDDGDCLGGTCLAYPGEATRVCFMPCAASGPECPEGLACVSFGELERCAPTSGSCACTPALSGNLRTCSVENGAGRCLGVEVCEEDTWSACSAEVPTAEVCNAEDDDCDGQIDEAARWENRGTPCAVGRGACAASGVWECDAADAGGPTVCSAEPGAPGVESCDGRDDDCDGATDEELLGPACPLVVGVCVGARAVCAGASGFLACNAGSYGAKYEAFERSCDGLDNDCDGVTDEVDLDGDGHVAAACGGDDCNDDERGAHAGLVESCGDGVDNDCDGSADNRDGDDDGFVDAACGGPDCDDAAAGVNPGAIERCGDGVDEDCSGALDDKDLDGDGERGLACVGGVDCDDDDPEVRAAGVEVWDAKDNDCDGTWDEGMIPVGTVVVTELMVAPAATSDADGEYIEVMNLGASPVNLRSWSVRDSGAGGGDAIEVGADVIVAPGGVAVLCREAASADNGGVTCAYGYGGAMALAEVGDEVVLSIGGVAIDRVAWDGRFPVTGGRALSLDPVQTGDAENDVYGNWCATPIAAPSRLAGGDYGSPGRVNPSCSGSPVVRGVEPDNGIMHGGDVLTVTGSGFIAATAVTVGGAACAAFEVVSDEQLMCTTPEHVAGPVAVEVVKGAAEGTLHDAFVFTGVAVSVITWVDLQYPKALTVSVGEESELVFGQVRAQGVTEAAGAPPGIRGQVGYGPLGTDPRTTPGWRWREATWNKQFFDNDEFMRTLVVPAPGAYSVAYRFSDDDGVNFMYGDFDPGTADGLSTGNLGTITVE